MAREPRARDWAAWMSGPPPRAPEQAGTPVPEQAAAPDEVDAPYSRTPPAPAAASASAADVEGPAGGPDPAQAEAPRSARREATRQRILDAALVVFAEDGVIGGTVEDICERAGFTRGAFYSNFADKDEVVDALVERELNRLMLHVETSFAAVEGDLQGAGDLAAIAGSLVDRILRSVPVDRQLSLVQAELEIFAIRRPGQAGRFVAINERFRERIGTFIAEAMRRNGRELLVAPLVLTDAVFAISQASVRRALLAGGGEDPDGMASAVLPGLLLAFSRPVEA